MSQTDHFGARQERIRHVVADCSRRRASGEEVLDESVIDEHPDLMPELAAELRKLGLIAKAGMVADATPPSKSNLESAGLSGLHIRCPHCHNPVELVADAPFINIKCGSCDSYFSILDRERAADDRFEGKQFGRFQILEQVGVGAFGSVWKARDIELDRMVAIKIPRKGQLDTDESEQFLREARAAAQLRHPNIVPMHEVGREGETIYIVSDFVHGQSLYDWLNDYLPTAQDAARLCATIADALNHAHENGVIHRDLKPSNIMVDVDDNPHIMDFGLAKRESGEITMTIEGRLLGTPGYMPPEQAKGEAHTADARSDIYSLGVILFEMLTGELPFRGNPRMMIQQAIHDEPPSPRKLIGAIPRDLETICLKCLQKEPVNRYPNAQALSDDLNRFLSIKPIQARPIGPMEKAWRWCRRKPVSAALAATSFVAVFAIAASAAFFLYNGELNEAMRQTQVALEHETEARTAEQKQRQLTSAALASAKANLYLYEIASSESAYLKGNLALAESRLEGCLENLQGWEWGYLKRQINGQLITLEGIDLRNLTGLIPHCCAFNFDGSLLAIASGHGTVVLWNTVRNRVDRMIVAHAGPVNAVRFSPDGYRLASAGADNRVVVWDVRTGQLLVKYAGHALPVYDMAFSPDGKQIASTALDMDDAGELRIWDAYTGLTDLDFTGPEKIAEVHSLVFTPDGQHLATVGHDGYVRLRDRKTGNTISEFHDPEASAIQAIVCTPDRKKLISASGVGDICVWDIETKTKTVLRGHKHVVNSLALSPDGRRLASGGFDQDVIIWDLVSKTKLSNITGHKASVVCVAFNPNGEHLVSRDAHGVVKFWKTDMSRSGGIKTTLAGDRLRLDNQNIVLSENHDNIPQSGESGGSAVEVCFSDERVLSVHMPLVQSPKTFTPAIFHDASSGRYLALGTGHASMSRARFSPDRTRLATVTVDTVLHVWGLSQRQELCQISKVNDGRFAWNVDGRRIAALIGDHTIGIFDSLTGDQLNTFKIPHQKVQDLAFAPDGQGLAVIGESQLNVLDSTDGSRQKTIPLNSPNHVLRLQYSPNGNYLAAGCLENQVLLFDMVNNRLNRLIGHTAFVLDVKFSSDSRRLISAGFDKSVKIWDVVTRQEAFTLPFDVPVFSVAMSADGKKIAAVGATETRIWSARPADEPIRIDPPFDQSSVALEFAKQGRHSQAMADAEDLLKGKRLHPWTIYNLACAFSLSSRSVLRSDNRATGEPQQISDQYAKQASRLLVRARENGLFVDPTLRTHVKHDSDLDPIRQKQEFAEFFNEIDSTVFFRNGQTVQNWGMAIVPDGISRIKLDGEQLHIQIPRGSRDLSIEMGIVNAPRVMREVEGDFDATIRVTYALSLKGPPTLPGRPIYGGGGLLLWSDTKNYARLERAIYIAGPRPYHYANFEARKTGKLVPRQTKPLPDIEQKTWYLRMIRRRGHLYGEISQDGEKWTRENPPIDLSNWPDKLSLGVSLSSTSGGPIEATFDELKLKRSEFGD